MDSFKTALSAIASGKSLSRDEAIAAFEALLSGDVTPAQAGAFLMGLRVRGESFDEIVGAVTAMRRKMLPVEADDHAIDIVGTGGDHSGSYNISTLAALIVAGCGVKVAKHGNRAASSKSGAADVLNELGVRIGLNPEELSRCLTESNLCFMFAQTHHASIRHVMPVRIEIGVRTLFNLIGPLANPAGVKRQLLGVPSKSWMEPLTQVLKELGSVKVWTVHGSDGLDEITTTGPTDVLALEQGSLRAFTIHPEALGFALADPRDLKGGDPAFNAAKLKAVLEGERGPYRDIAVLNAAAALVIADYARDLPEGVAQAQTAIENGAAKVALDNLVAASNR